MRSGATVSWSALDTNGDVIWKEEYSDMILAPLVCDIDSDGHNELILPCGDDTIVCHSTPGLASRSEWRVTGGSYRRLYNAGAVV